MSLFAASKSIATSSPISPTSNRSNEGGKRIIAASWEEGRVDYEDGGLRVIFANVESEVLRLGKGKLCWWRRKGLSRQYGLCLVESDNRIFIAVAVISYNG